LPVNSIGLDVSTIVPSKTRPLENGWGGRIRTYACGNQNPVP
jgi:hypothetical protein